MPKKKKSGIIDRESLLQVSRDNLYKPNIDYTIKMIDFDNSPLKLQYWTSQKSQNQIIF